MNFRNKDNVINYNNIVKKKDKNVIRLFREQLNSSLFHLCLKLCQIRF